jgi:hypothetical protein
MCEALHRLGVPRLLSRPLDLLQMRTEVEPDREIFRRPFDRRLQSYLGQRRPLRNACALATNACEHLRTSRKQRGDIGWGTFDYGQGHHVIIDHDSGGHLVTVLVAHQFHEVSFAV